MTQANWVQTRPYSNVASGLKSRSSSVQQSKGEYKVLNKSNAYGYISRIKLGLICIKLSLDTRKVSFYKYICKRHLFSVYSSEKGVCDNFKCC
jgi:hypothetical protein